MKPSDIPIDSDDIALGCLILLKLAFVAGLIYIAWHFIAKYW